MNVLSICPRLRQVHRQRRWWKLTMSWKPRSSAKHGSCTLHMRAQPKQSSKGGGD